MLLFLHFYDGDVCYPDDQGQEFSSVEAARHEAGKSAAELVALQTFSGSSKHLRFEIVDYLGQVRAEVPLAKALPPNSGGVLLTRC